MTEIGVEMVKLFEHFEASVYLDDAGNPTVGYGHLLKSGETFTEPLTEAEAEELLRQDLAIHRMILDSTVHVPLKEWEDDALTSFVFNLGPRGMTNPDGTKTGVCMAVNASNPTLAADEMTRWVHSGGKRSTGLVRRRNAEACRFLGADIGLIRSVFASE